MERNIEALKQLRRVVEAAPDHLLHMRGVVEKCECGTARCALGWAIIDPWFRKNTLIGKLVPKKYNSFHMPAGYDQIADEVFGLDPDDADALFAGESDRDNAPHAVSKEEVLANIDRLIKGHSALPYDCFSYYDSDED